MLLSHSGDLLGFIFFFHPDRELFLPFNDPPFPLRWLLKIGKKEQWIGWEILLLLSSRAHLPSFKVKDFIYRSIWWYTQTLNSFSAMGQYQNLKEKIEQFLSWNLIGKINSKRFNYSKKNNILRSMKWSLPTINTMKNKLLIESINTTIISAYNPIQIYIFGSHAWGKLIKKVIWIRTLALENC